MLKKIFLTEANLNQNDAHFTSTEELNLSVVLALLDIR